MSARQPSPTTTLAKVVTSRYNWTAFATSDREARIELLLAKTVRIQSHRTRSVHIVPVNDPKARYYTLAINTGTRLILRNGGGCLKGCYPEGDMVEITIVEWRNP